MTAPAVRPELAALPTNPLGYVLIGDLDPPAGFVIPNRADPDVQALLAATAERRAPDQPLRVVATAAGFALADMGSFRRWWALRHACSTPIGQVLPKWVVIADTDAEPSPTPAPTSVPPTPTAEPGAPERLPLDAIRTDGGTQARVAMHGDTVEEYADALRAGIALPAVEVVHDGEAYWLTDGFHRVAAARLAGLTDIAVVVRPGTLRDAVLAAVGANARHGLRRSSQDKRRCVEMLLGDPEWGRWSDRAVAEKCGVDHKTVAAVRASLTGEIPQCSVRQTADGRVMDTANIGRKPVAAIDSSSVRPVEVQLARANAPEAAANDDINDAVPREARDTSRSPSARPAPDIQGRLDAAGDQVVRLLAQFAAVDPAGASAWVERHALAIGRSVA